MHRPKFCSSAAERRKRYLNPSSGIFNSEYQSDSNVLMDSQACDWRGYRALHPVNAAVAWELSLVRTAGAGFAVGNSPKWSKNQKDHLRSAPRLQALLVRLLEPQAGHGVSVLRVCFSEQPTGCAALNSLGAGTCRPIPVEALPTAGLHARRADCASHGSCLSAGQLEAVGCDFTAPGLARTEVLKRD